MKKVKTKGILLAAIVLAGMMLTTAKMPVGTAASQIDINNAIEDGLAYLNKTQDRLGGPFDGSWGRSYAPVACTAMVVLAFENAPNNHFGWNLSDPYHTTVQNGLNWLFSQASVVPISSSNSAGDPENTTHNGFGVGWYSDGNSVYETPMALMAIIASTAPTNVTTNGTTNVIGRTYKDVAQDIVDWIAWAQNSVPSDGVYEGGWRYQPKEGDSDNSVSQWPVLGLITAQEAWNITAPSWVGTELLKWIAADQDLSLNSTANPVYGTFDYQPGRGLGTPTDTATGILELTYCGAKDTDPKVIAAEGYLSRDWNPNGWSPNGRDYGWNWNIGSLYNMYAVMKAMRETTPNATQFVANYDGTPGVEWYNGTGEYADELISVAHHHPDGSWADWVNWAEYLDPSLSTAFGVLILEFRIVPNKGNLEVTVVDAATNKTINGSIVTILGPESRAPNVTGSYGDGEVAFLDLAVGNYTVNASMVGYFPNSTIASVYDGVTTNCIIPLEPIPTVHDVAVVDVTPECDRIYQGKLCYARTNVTVSNLGNATEDFNVTVYYADNNTGSLHGAMGTQQVLGLVSGEARILTFLWNTTNVAPCHFYNITACASVVLGESNIANNNMSSPTLIKVKLFGDVNGDGKVDGKDVALAALSFGSIGPNFLYQGSPSSPRWNQDADVSNDYKIDGKDCVLICLNWGKAC